MSLRGSQYRKALATCLLRRPKKLAQGPAESTASVLNSMLFPRDKSLMRRGARGREKDHVVCRVTGAVWSSAPDPVRVTAAVVVIPVAAERIDGISLVRVRVFPPCVQIPCVPWEGTTVLPFGLNEG